MLVLACREAVALDVRLLPEASVEGRLVRLADVAEIRGERKAAARLGELELSPAPAPGATLILSSTSVCGRSRRAGGGKTVACGGPDVRVRSDVEPLPPARLQALLDSLAHNMGGPGKSYSALWLSSGEVRVPRRAHALRLDREDHRDAGRVRLALSALREAKAVARWTLYARFRRFEETWVASRDIERGELLTEACLRRERRETTDIHEPLLGAHLAGAEARQFIEAGRPLVRRLAALPPLVRRGEAVKLMVRSGGLEVAARAVAKQNGAAGEVVAAKNLASGRLIRARVAENGMLRPLPGHATEGTWP